MTEILRNVTSVVLESVLEYEQWLRQVEAQSPQGTFRFPCLISKYVNMVEYYIGIMASYV